MASGFGSLHPRQVDTLEELGITSGQVTQGVGHAAASAGYHSPEGENPAGHKYSSCFDLAWELAAQGTTLRDRLVAAGICPFYRYPPQWSGSRHIHCVSIGLRGGDGECHILPGPRQQIIDYTRGKNGLVGHAAYPAKWAPNEAQKARLLAAYTAWAPGVATAVLAPEGNRILCYAFLEGDAVCCEARAFLLYWGALVTWHTDHLEAAYKGKALDLSTAHLQLEGDFTRGDLRPLAEALGLKVKFNWSADRLSAEVRLGY